MKLELSLATEQEQLVEVTQQTAPNLRKEFAESMGASAMSILRELPQSPEVGYIAMIDRVEAILGRRKGADNARVLAKVLRTDDVRRAALADPAAVSALGEKEAMRLSVAYMHADAERQGGFRLLRKGDAVPVHVRVVRSLLEDAVTDQAALRANVQEKTELARSHHASEGLIIEIRERLEALNVAEILRPRFETLARSIALAHALTDDDERPFRDYFDDLVVLRQLGTLSTDATQRQFASRMSDGLDKGDDFADLRLPLLNVVTRHAGVAMGFIEPKVQKLFKHCYDAEALERARAELNARKIGALLDRPALRSRDDVFWLRRQGWEVPARGGGGLLEAALTELVRSDGDALLRALQAEQLFADARAIGLSEERGRHADADTRDVARVEIRGLLTQAMTRPMFTECLTQALQRWTPVLRARLAAAASDPRFAAIQIVAAPEEGDDPKKDNG